MATKKEAAAAGAAQTEELSLLDRIAQEGKTAVEPSHNAYAKQLPGQFATQILDAGIKAAPDQGVASMIHERVAGNERTLRLPCHGGNRSHRVL